MNLDEQVWRVRHRLWRTRRRLARLLLGAPPRIRREIGSDAPVYIIAEIGINHQGDPALARQLIDEAVAAGADCVKFQMRDLDVLYGEGAASHDARQNLTTQYSLDLLRKVQLPKEEMFRLFDYVKSKGVQVMCTPFDLKSVEDLKEYGMEMYKIGSPDMTNHDLIKAVAKTRRPLIVSTGMSEEHEIRKVDWLLRRLGARYTLLHCNSTYPAPFEDINLQLMDKLGSLLYGYSGHERGYAVAIAAVARGAKIIERHITLDRDLEGTDHKASLLPHEFKAMVEGIRQVERALGTATKRTLTQGERMNRANLAKSIVAARPIKKGEYISEDMLDVRSPGRGLQPDQKEELVGRRARRDMDAGDLFYSSDLLQRPPQPRAYACTRPWGLPVRFHDFRELLEKSNPSLLEFHMSYRDLDIDPAAYCERDYEVGLVVHGVETFANDHIIDLAANDEAYRASSIANVQRCIDHARSLKRFFPNTTRPLLILNAGGFTREAPLKAGERPARYAQIAESLRQLDAEGVELIMQTMPPYPWLLGGQLFHNLFLDPEDTAAFCQEHGYRLCFDTSHSHLAANHLGRTLTEFVHALGPYIAHLHIADGAGVSEEGLQIGDGTIDFRVLARDLNRHAPNATFIPEIWQGHENGGEGFWLALERLEPYF